MSLDHDDDDDFAPFLSQELHMNITNYVQTYFNAAKRSDSPNHALNERHEVDNVSVNKDEDGPRHESFTASVNDEDTKDKHMFILERTAGANPPDPFAYCTQSPDSKQVIDAIQDALQAGALSASPSISSTNGDTSPSVSRMAQAIHTAMYSARSSARSFAVEAEDTISGVNKNRKLGKTIRQYDPVGLTLFHLVLLALVVHKLAPIYSLFESQCYWFANIIFDVIVALYPSRTQTRPDPVSGPCVLLPSDYLPQEFGRFCGITINDPRVVAAVVSTVESHFKENKEAYEQKLLRTRKKFD